MNLDIINNVLIIIHSIVVANILNYCLGEDRKKIKYLIIWIYISIIVILTYNNDFYITQPFVIIALVIFSAKNYKRNPLDIVLIYLIMYTIFSVIIISTYIVYILEKNYNIQIYDMDKHLFRTCIELAIQYFIFKMRYKIKVLFEILKDNKKFLIGITIINTLLQSIINRLYVMPYCNLRHSKIGILICVIFFIIMMLSFRYFIKITLQSIDINTLRLSIENKNNQLRKLKHDYGAQISYLHGLYLLKRYDEMAAELDGLKRVNEETSCTAEVSTEEGSIMAEIVRQAMDYGIHIMIYEHGEYDKFILKKDTFIQAIIDIINIQVKYMDKGNVIIIKTYNSLGRLFIDINFQSLECDKVIVQKLLNDLDIIQLRLKKRSECIREIKEKILLDNKKDFKLKFKHGIHLRSFNLKLIVEQ